MLNIILCGGSGSRLWPLSRELQPKQFINLGDNKSLFQKTAIGNSKYCSEAIVVCNVEHHFLAQKQLNSSAIQPKLYILEPLAKNTAAAVTLAIMAADPEDIVLVTPSDHQIDYANDYAKALKLAEAFAREDKVVVFGIVPHAPETGYGYIESKGEDVLKFHEKPNMEVAIKYLAAGNYFWNSGMLCVKARVFLEGMQQHASDIYEATKIAFDRALTKIQGNVLRVDTNDMANIRAESVDYALLEKSDDLKVIRSDFRWSDLGSFDSLFFQLPKDGAGNALETKSFYGVGAKNNLIISDHRVVSAIDVEDLVVIDTKDALLISKLGSTQKVKEVVSQLKVAGSTLPVSHIEEMRPWGNFTVLESSEKYKVKRIVVHPGKRLSLQKHFHRSEHWVVVAGSALVTVGTEQKLVHPNQGIYINVGEVHRVENPGKIDLVIIEVQHGDYTGEDDIVRIEDDFKRVPLEITVSSKN